MTLQEISLKLYNTTFIWFTLVIRFLSLHSDWHHCSSFDAFIEKLFFCSCASTYDGWHNKYQLNYCQFGGESSGFRETVSIYNVFKNHEYRRNCLLMFMLNIWISTEGSYYMKDCHILRQLNWRWVDVTQGCIDYIFQFIPCYLSHRTWPHKMGCVLRVLIAESAWVRRIGVNFVLLHLSP